MGNAIISRREQRELKKTKENYDFEEKLLPEELKSCTTKYTCFLCSCTVRKQATENKR